MDRMLPPAADPYAPPKSDLDADVGPATGDKLAERGTRLAAAIVDGILYLVVIMPAVFMGLRTGFFAANRGKYALYRLFVSSPLGMACLVAWLALTAVQAYLIATTGQSIAKRMFKIKIVKMDGSPAGFLSGVVVRNWLLVALQQIPGVAMVLPWVDALSIFRQDRRCLHDHIAGTKVIDAR